LEKQDQPVSPFSRSGQPGRFPGWKLHPLKGALKGSWSQTVSLTVTGHWRSIFRYNGQKNTASDIDLIDYRQGD
jgi:plasmid maintenance system killer protein